MENRVIEIARKKAQKHQGKSEQAKWKSRETNPAFFMRADSLRSPQFPPEIKLERRSLAIDSASALIIPIPLRAVSSGTVALKPAKPAAKRKPSVKKAQKPRVAKPDVKAKPVKKPATRKPRAKKIPAQPVVAETLSIAIPPTIAARLEQPTTPLPRARAVAVYRKNGIFDVLGYWMRTGVSGIFKLLTQPPKTGKRVPKIGDLLAENAALRQEIARLRALQ